MSEFNVRPVNGYRAPRYPAAPAVGESPQPPFIANRLSKLAPLALILAPMTASASPATPVVTVDAPPRESGPSIPAAIPQAAIDALVAIADQDAPPVMQGKIAAPSRCFSEAEVAAAVKDVLADLGIKTEAATITRDGVKMKLAALRGDSAVAVTELLSKPAQEELALLRARGEMKVLMLTARELEYETYAGGTGGRLPTREIVLRRLRAELESFLK